MTMTVWQPPNKLSHKPMFSYNKNSDLQRRIQDRRTGRELLGLNNVGPICFCKF